MARSFTLRNAISLLAAGLLASAPVSEASSLHNLHHRHLEQHPYLRHHERASNLEAQPSVLETRDNNLDARDNNIRKRAVPSYVAQGFSLTWADDFTTGTSGLAANWIFDLGHNYPGGPWHWGTGEVQEYTSSSSNIFVDGSGNLNIVPIKDSNGDWTSSRIESKRTFICQNGGRMIVEARIKLSSVTTNKLGIWPAFWAMGKAFRDNGNSGWPTTGELDIMENINAESRIFNVVHCGTNGGGPCDEYNGIGTTTPITRGVFHTHRLIIDRTQSDWHFQTITWQTDGVQTFQLKGNSINDPSAWTALTQREIFMLLNVAVGGSLPDAFSGGVQTPTQATTGGPDSSMIVDYVAVFNAPPAGTTTTRTTTTTTSRPAATTTAGAVTTPSPIQNGQTGNCAGWRYIQPSDTCSNLVTRFSSIGLTLQNLVSWNPALGSTSNCSPTPGYFVCVQLKAGTPPPPGSTPSPIQPGQTAGCGGWRYTQSSDTCANLVTRFSSINLSLAELVKWNPALGSTSNCRVTPGYFVCVELAPPSPIQPGQVKGCAGWRYVQPSDTCANIVSRFSNIGLTLSNLVRWNPALGSTSNCRTTPGNFVCVQI
ncbi:Carbohydrate binding 6 [Orbilia brochopaga]|uniref:Carbohydrate binding 6 n=1 Tax=Orbilia brochopaga TaxID=3140254 RepID=A0AAV9UVH4_9PEZI